MCYRLTCSGKVQPPKFAQLYFYDTQNEAENRENIFTKLSGDAIRLMQDCMHLHNPYIASLKCGIELMESCPDVQLVLHGDSTHKPSDEHCRTYNLPTASEVGAIRIGDVTNNIDVILHNRTGDPVRISPYHRSYDPLHYVALFPRGEDGVQLGLQRANNKTLTALDYYAYRLQVRENEWNVIMKSRRLLQQYAVDMWSKIEGGRLDWVRRNQTIRAEKYNGLIDALNDNDLPNAGRRMILPPTIYGSPRFYSEKFQDAMSYVHKFGRRDIFITFTCNAK